MATQIEPAARDWIEVAEEIASAISAEADRHDREESFVEEGFGMLKQAGLFKALVPVEFGGHGATHGEICRVVRRLGASCGSTALAFSMHCHMVSVAAWRWRHQNAPTEGLLKRIAGEDLVLVSSGGSDWLKSAGTAVRTEGGFLITARKAFASASPVGDLLVTSAVYDDPEAGLTVLQTLLQEPYLSTDPGHQGLLLHSVYHWPNGWDYVPEGSNIPRGESSRWGDYHLREAALYVQKLLRDEPYYTFFNCLGR